MIADQNNKYKILMFYGSYDGGHLSAARNIKDYIDAKDIIGIMVPSSCFKSSLFLSS